MQSSYFQNKVYEKWLLINVLCCQMTSYFENQKCLNKEGLMIVYVKSR